MTLSHLQEGHGQAPGANWQARKHAGAGSSARVQGVKAAGGRAPGESQAGVAGLGGVGGVPTQAAKITKLEPWVGGSMSHGSMWRRLLQGGWLRIAQL